VQPPLRDLRLVRSRPRVLLRRRVARRPGADRSAPPAADIVPVLKAASIIGIINAHIARA
jgi:hypothetical protein